MKDTENIIPFSNGTEAMNWMESNCNRCTKAYFPKEGNWPSEKTLKQYVRIGKYCKLQYHLDMGYLLGHIPSDIAQQIGMDEVGRMKHCMFFSDDDNDRFRYPPHNPDDDIPGNQLVMPFIFQEDEVAIETLFVN